MKQTKKLKREHKIMLSDKGKDPGQYRLVRDYPRYTIFRNMETGATITVAKRLRGYRR